MEPDAEGAALWIRREFGWELIHLAQEPPCLVVMVSTQKWTNDVGQLGLGPVCHHPDLPVFSGCNPADKVCRGDEGFENDPQTGPGQGCGLCIVEIEGEQGPVLACETQANEGLKVVTQSETLDTLRKERLSALMADHPRLCIICPHREGCDRLNCTMSVPQEQRCCSEFNDCELRAVVDYVGINRNIPEYVPAGIPSIKGGKLFEFNFNLCIGCLRCVRACRDMQEVGALAFVRQNGKVVVGTVEPTLQKSGCKFCGACVAVCPTGAMISTSEKCGSKLTITPVRFPPKEYLEFNETVVAQVPEEGGVVQLLDEEENIVYIAGTSNMRRELNECLKTAKGVKYLVVEEDAMYTQRQNELIQQYLDKHGEQPRINAELDDLF